MCGSQARRSTKRRARKEADSIGEVVQEISSQDSPIKNNANPQTTNSSTNTVIMTGKGREVLGPSRKGGVSHQRRKSMPKQVGTATDTTTHGSHLSSVNTTIIVLYNAWHPGV